MKKSQRFLIKKPAETLDFVECQAASIAMSLHSENVTFNCKSRMSPNLEGPLIELNLARGVMIFKQKLCLLTEKENWGQISTFNIDSVFICDIIPHGEAIEDSISRSILSRHLPW